MRTKFTCIALFIAICSFSWSQDEHFNAASVPSGWNTIQNGALSISTEHYKKSGQSLKWDYQPGDVLTVTDLINKGLDTTEVSAYHYHSFRMWLYNSTPQPGDSVYFEFYDANGNLQYHFPFYLDFTGWRAMLVSYNHDMGGNHSSQNLDEMKIYGPSSSTELFIDYVDFTRSRNLGKAPDYQLPYLTNELGRKSHWYDLMDYEAEPKFIPLTTPSTTELNELTQVKYYYDSLILGSAPSASAVSTAINNYNNLNITYTGGIIKGKPLFGLDYSSSETIAAVDKYIWVLAKDYKHNPTATRLQQFIWSVRYFLDQGYASGSMVETIHHIGYGFRNLPHAIHLMKDELITEGLWEEARDMVEWYSAMESIWELTAEYGNMDEGNTRSIQKLGAILYLPTDAEKIQYLKGFKAYLQHWYQPRGMKVQGFKPDHSAFHHSIHYPGYSHPALNNVGKCLYLLRNSPTYLPNSTTLTHAEKSLKTTRLTMGGVDIPISLSGRNPFSFPPIHHGLQYGGLGMANQAVIAIYNKMYNQNVNNIPAEPLPNGFWQFNYMPMGVYRNNDWVANIKGFNNNFYGTEIYSSANRYGRYQSYGAIEILYDAGIAASGCSEDGWDWNKVPGTTTIHLPWSELLAESGRMDEKTNSSFAGALRFNTPATVYHLDKTEGQYGVFGMDFQQMQPNNGTYHDSSFTFKKSVFCFDGKLICLGSDINNDNSSSSTATNLFQGSFGSSSDVTIINGSNISSTNYSNQYSGNNSNWILDHYGNGYYIQSGDDIELLRTSQTTPYETGSGNGTGTYASAWIDHGTAPNNASYEYMIIPETNSASMSSMNPGNLYQVHQHNNDAHIVQNLQNDIIGYVCFNPTGSTSSPGYINTFSTTCLAMEQLVGSNLHLSVCDPNIIFNPSSLLSETTTITLTLSNEWSILSSSVGVSINNVGNNETSISFQVQDGLPSDVVLEPSSGQGCLTTYGFVTSSNCDNYTYNGQTYTSSGIYSDTLINAAGCDSIVTVNVTIWNNPIVSAGPDVFNCLGQQTTLSGSGAVSYTWSGGVTDGVPFNAPTGTSSYVVTGTDGNGCMNTDTVEVTQFQLDTTISLTGNTLSINNQQGTFQWIDCTTNTSISSQTGTSYSPGVNGTYACVITNQGCTDTTDCIQVTLSNIVDMAATAINIYPSVTTDLITISSNSPITNDITIYNMIGQIIKTIEPNNLKTITVNLEKEARGSYLISHNNNYYTIIKQ